MWGVHYINLLLESLGLVIFVCPYPVHMGHVDCIKTFVRSLEDIGLPSVNTILVIGLHEVLATVIPLLTSFCWS